MDDWSDPDGENPVGATGDAVVAEGVCPVEDEEMGATGWAVEIGVGGSFLPPAYSQSLKMSS